MADPNPNPNPEPTPESAPKPITFDAFLKTPENQAEFDRRLAKAIKTAQDKAAEDGVSKDAVAELRQKLAEQGTQLTDYMNREAAIKAGIDPRYLKFVTFEVGQNVKDGTDFATALDEYVKANPQYTAQAQPAPTPPAAGWGQPQQGAPGAASDGVTERFKALNPTLKLE